MGISWFVMMFSDRQAPEWRSHLLCYPVKVIEACQSAQTGFSLRRIQISVAEMPSGADRCSN
jgi:hypothetical protein